jgi:hypothetical protein
MFVRLASPKKQNIGPTFNCSGSICQYNTQSGPRPQVSIEATRELPENTARQSLSLEKPVRLSVQPVQRSKILGQLSIVPEVYVNTILNLVHDHKGASRLRGSFQKIRWPTHEYIHGEDCNYYSIWSIRPNDSRVRLKINHVDAATEFCSNTIGHHTESEPVGRREYDQR